jgi:hypothetical protein
MRAIQLGNGASIFNWSGGNLGNINIGSNIYDDGNGAQRYINSSVGSSMYGLFSGNHAWYIAPLGTAGNVITFTQAMTLDSNGRLFIGSATGIGNEKALIVTDSSGTYTQALNLKDTNASANGTNFIVIRKNDDTYLGTIGRSGTDNAMAVNGNSYLSLQTGLTERMRVTSAGNVGIGTTSPSELMVVYGLSTSKPRLVVGQLTTSTALYSTYNSQDTTAIEVNTSTTTGFAGFIMSNSNNTSGNTLGTISFAAAGTSNGEKRGAIIGSTLESAATSSVTANLVFYTTSASSVAERMRITSTGEITFAQSRSLYTTASNGFLALYGNGGGLYMGGSIANDMLLTGGGNLLVGTNTDNGERLYVSGSIRATGSITANSDVRLKKNIERIENALQKVSEISGYTYNTIYDEDRHAGVIAQEIDKVLPEIVNKGNDGLMGVEYGNISALLIEAIKDLKKDNESLRAIVEGLSK